MALVDSFVAMRFDNLKRVVAELLNEAIKGAVDEGNFDLAAALLDSRTEGQAVARDLARSGPRSTGRRRREDVGS
jgi:hypothetical protein